MKSGWICWKNHDLQFFLCMQEGQLRDALIPLAGLPREPASWKALCNATAAGDHRALRHLLAWRQHRVPDVEGAAGEALNT